MCPNGSLLVLMRPYVCLCVFTGPKASLWILKNTYRSLCVVMDSKVFL